MHTKKGAEAPVLARTRQSANLAAPQAPRPSAPKAHVLGALRAPSQPRQRRGVPGGANGAAQAVNELPQPQPPVAFGFLNVKPAPIMVVT
jgi:hypothetical protein